MANLQTKLTGSKGYQDVGTVGQTNAQLAGNMQSVNQIFDVGLANTNNYDDVWLRASHLVDLGFATLSGNVLTAAAQASGGGTTITVGGHSGISTLNFSGASVTASGSTATVTITGGGGSPGGSTTYVQYNAAGSFGGTLNFTTDGAGHTVIQGSSSSAGPLLYAKATSGNGGITLLPSTASQVPIITIQDSTVSRTLELVFVGASASSIYGIPATQSGINAQHGLVLSTNDVAAYFITSGQHHFWDVASTAYMALTPGTGSGTPVGLAIGSSAVSGLDALLKAEDTSSSFRINYNATGDNYLDGAITHFRSRSGTEVMDVNSGSGYKVTISNTSDSQLQLNAAGGQFATIGFAETGTDKTQMYWDNTAQTFNINTIGHAWDITDGTTSVKNFFSSAQTYGTISLTGGNNAYTGVQLSVTMAGVGSPVFMSNTSQCGVFLSNSRWIFYEDGSNFRVTKPIVEDGSGQPYMRSHVTSATAGGGVVTAQSGGTPTGGNDGDICFVF